MCVYTTVSSLVTFFFHVTIRFLLLNQVSSASSFFIMSPLIDHGLHPYNSIEHYVIFQNMRSHYNVNFPLVIHQCGVLWEICCSAAVVKDSGFLALEW